MVRIECISLWISKIFGVWWLHMVMVVVERVSLVAILAWWIASRWIYGLVGAIF